MYKSENFKASLNAYAEIIANYVDSHRLIADKRLDSLNNLLPLLPRGLRVSIIDRQGKVLYDNDIDEEETVENHLSRPEIAQALTQSNGRIFVNRRLPVSIIITMPAFSTTISYG